MEPVQHQMMGYDRAITMFSPDGRLLQVEYAKKTVHQGSTAIGVICKDGVLLVADKRVVDPLIVSDAIEKIWEIDNHIGATASGILSDARVLVERAQLFAQRNKITYDSSVDVSDVVKDVCNLKQLCTQSGGLRPFGVSLLIAGVDVTGPVLYQTDPTGIFFQYKACAIGEGEEGVSDILHKEYRETMTIKDALKLCLSAMRRVLDKEFNSNRIEAAYISSAEKMFTKVKKDEIEKSIREMKK